MAVKKPINPEIRDVRLGGEVHAPCRRASASALAWPSGTPAVFRALAVLQGAKGHGRHLGSSSAGGLA